MTIQSINPTLAQLDHLSDSVRLRPKDCAQVCGISLSTYWRLVKKGQIRAEKLTERTTTTSVGDLLAFLNQKEGV